MGLGLLAIMMASSCATVYKSQRKLVDVLVWPAFVTDSDDANARALGYCQDAGYSSRTPRQITGPDAPGVLEYILFPFYFFQGEVYTYSCRPKEPLESDSAES